MKKMVFSYFRDNGYCDNFVNKDYKKIDVLNYAFGKIVDGNLDVSHLENLSKVLELRKKGLKVVIVLDGVSKETREKFIEISNTKETREKFANSVYQCLEEYQLDGIDLDWEFPEGIEQINNFTYLCKDIKEKLMECPRKLILSSAIIGTNVEKHYDLKELNKYLDYLHIMTYNMGDNRYASHNSPLKSSAMFKDSMESALDNCLRNGFDGEKIVLGIPFYVKTGKLASSSPILGQKYIENSYKSVSNNIFLNDYSKRNNFKEYFDEECLAYYSFDGETFTSFENEESVRRKCEYIIEKGICGVMFWDYGHDKEHGILLDTIYKTFLNN